MQFFGKHTVKFHFKSGLVQFHQSHIVILREVFVLKVSRMSLFKCIFICVFIFRLLICQFVASDQYVVNIQFEFGSQIKPLQQQWIVEPQRVDFSQLFSPDDWFPIEINVPDTAMDIWHGAQSAWTFASDYFSMENENQ